MSHSAENESYGAGEVGANMPESDRDVFQENLMDYEETNPVGPEDQTIELNDPVVENIKVLQDQFNKLSIQVNKAVQDPVVGPSEIQVLLDKSRNVEKTLRYFQKVHRDNISEVKALESAALSVSRTPVMVTPVYQPNNLSRSVLPMFQLVTDVPKLFPSHEAFDTVEQFLSTFVKIIKASSLDIETA